MRGACLFVAFLCGCSGERVAVHVSLALAPDQSADFAAVKTIVLRLSAPGQPTIERRTTFSNRVASVPDLPLLPAFDLHLEGLDDSGASIFYGRKDGVSPPSAGIRSLEILVRRRNDFAQTLVRPSVPRRFHTATRLPGGGVLIAGGENPATGEPLGSAEIFDPETATFRPTGALAHPRAHHAGALLSDGRVVIAGGVAGSSYPLEVEIYDPAAGRFERAGALTVGRAELTASVYRSGATEKVLFAGGRGPSGPHASADLYTPGSRTVGQPRTMTEARAGHAAVELPDGVLVVGGTAASGRAEIFRAATEQFALTTGAMAAPRPRAIAVFLGTGAVLVGGSSASLESFTPGTGTFAPAADLPAGVGGGALALLPGDRVLVVGGSGSQPLATASTLSGSMFVAPVGGLDFARAGHTATALSDGTVLVAGGSEEASAEVFLPLPPP